MAQLLEIPLKLRSSASSGTPNRRCPDEETAIGRNGWKAKPFTVSADSSEV